MRGEGQSHHRRSTNERGQVLLLSILVMTVVLVMGAVVFDVGMALSEKERVQSATDASALAAALELANGGSEGDAETTACNIYQANGFDACPTVNIPPLQGPHAGDDRYVEVTASVESFAAFLEVITGTDSFLPGARSVAAFIGATDQAPCGVCILSPSANPALAVNGNGSLTVNSSVSINSNGAQSVAISGNAVLTAGSIETVGGSQVNGNHAEFNPEPTAGEPFGDPLSSIPVPFVSGPSFGALVTNTAQTIDPGIYNSISTTAALTLNPGIYVIKGTGAPTIPGLSVTGNAGRITGSGVTLYFACPSYPDPCAPGQLGAGLSIAGQGVFDPTAPTIGTYGGLLIFFDRNNVATLRMSGNAVVDLTGTVYGKSASWSVTGNGAVGQFNSLIVFNTANIAGNGIVVDYDPAENFPPGNTTAPSVSLVE
jgi:hypothetical protein